MNYLVAVSGGVDSVVLLDMLAQTEHDIVVAHVDHGIREDSAADARFVRELAARYKLPFVMHEAHLGLATSEDQARQARYTFLFDQARQHNAVIVTAQHLDDLIETVALNLERGTGWRGLGVMAREGIWRPFLQVPKRILYDYALRRRLEWVEDSTNQSDVYQRNRLRRKLHDKCTFSQRQQVHSKWLHQLQLRHNIDKEVATLMEKHEGSRYFLSQLEEPIAIECLAREIEAAGGVRPTRPQLMRALLAVKTARPGTSHHVGTGVSLQFKTRNYLVKVV
ncbi:MAG: tRNA lysidine(34) synthetase TilS [Candidatus Saccharimonas sp.]